MNAFGTRLSDDSKVHRLLQDESGWPVLRDNRATTVHPYLPPHHHAPGAGLKARPRSRRPRDATDVPPQLDRLIDTQRLQAIQRTGRKSTLGVGGEKT